MSGVLDADASGQTLVGPHAGFREVDLYAVEVDFAEDLVRANEVLA